MSSGDICAVRQTWLFGVVATVQRFAIRAAQFSPEELFGAATELAGLLPEAQSVAEVIALRGILLETALRWQDQLHRERGTSDESCACRSLLGANTKSGPLPPSEMFVNWAREFAQLFAAQHATSISQRAARFIRESYTTRHSVAELAAFCRCAPKELRRAFRSELGVSIRDYCTRVRLERAVELIQRTDDKVEWIAMAVGFASKRHLYAALRAGGYPTPSQMRGKRAFTISTANGRGANGAQRP